MWFALFPPEHPVLLKHLCLPYTVFRRWFPMNLCLKIILWCFCVYQGMLCVWFANILPPLVWLAAKTSVLWPIVNTKQVSMVSFFMGLRVDQIKTQSGKVQQSSCNKGERETDKKTSKILFWMSWKCQDLYSCSQLNSQLTGKLFFKISVGWIPQQFRFTDEYISRPAGPVH